MSQQLKLIELPLPYRYNPIIPLVADYYLSTKGYIAFYIPPTLKTVIVKFKSKLIGFATYKPHSDRYIFLIQIYLLPKYRYLFKTFLDHLFAMFPKKIVIGQTFEPHIDRLFSKLTQKNYLERL